MSGIYLHIPFCKQACHYCNFHFSTSLRYKGEMVAAIARELVGRKDYLPDEPLRSIYFGGGTPSLLAAEDIGLLMDTIYTHFNVASGAEITLEANPDDITPAHLRLWKDNTINRLSIGVQSFHEEDLLYMNRAHNANEARNSIEMAQEVGFHNLTVDLIYGAPTTTDEVWANNVQTLLALGVSHISSYALTVEPKTALEHLIRHQKAAPLDEAQSARQYEYLMKVLTTHGFLHYEISNFALPDHLAVHNSSYWRGAPYLGVGPSAHSFNGQSRQWNIANNAHYLRAMSEDNNWQEAGEGVLFEKETLSATDRYNEYVMTGLRTIWGVNLQQVEQPFRQHFLENAQAYISKKMIHKYEDIYTLTTKGKLLADKIASDLFC
ncbi:MAG: radical SAM family heme chaperone HemW [Saprospiraceae bacterium]